jgi:hypothetical protein
MTTWKMTYVLVIFSICSQVRLPETPNLTQVKIRVCHTQYVDRELTMPVNIVKGAMTPMTIPAVGVKLKSVPMETAARSN